MSREYKNFKEIPMSPTAMDTFFTSDKALWKGTSDYSEEKHQQTKKKIKEVKKAINDHLTPRQREVIDLYYFKNKTQADISVILGVHQTTISQHLQYGIKKLRKVFNKTIRVGTARKN
ncbi:MAG: sigma-70 family RNA polymerase sigma factor [bacterium]